MKQAIAYAFVLVLLAGLMCGCAAPPAPETSAAPSVPGATAAPPAPEGSTASAAPEAPAQADNISIVCTIFPLYDWVRQILGEKAAGVELTLLMQSGVDLHSYQPTVQDMVNIAQCDMFVYVGGESDTWVEDALAQAQNPNILALDLLAVISGYGGRVEMEELVEGMQPEENHEHAEQHEDEHEEQHAQEEEGHEHEEGEEAPDEHVWLSLKNAEACCYAIYEGLCALVLDGGETPDANAKAATEAYQANTAAYVEKLRELDARYAAAVAAAPGKTLLFCDRFPFLYLVKDYGIDYYAAFPGCSAETEASFNTIAFLTEKLDELGLANVMVTESADQSIANTVIAATAEKDQHVLVMNAMQSVTAAQMDSGASYLSLMEDNLRVLQEGLAA